MSFLFIAIGGFFGAISRYALSNMIKNKFTTAIAYGTLVVNLVGSFLLGLLVGMQLEEGLYQLFCIGFLGAFTTFSTFKVELYGMILKKEYISVFQYLVLSYIFGIAFAMIGFVIGRG